MEEKVEQINELFTEYIEILPSIELQDDDSFPGKIFKLRAHLDESKSAFQTLAMIFFELQYLLHRHNERSDTDDYSMMVSKLILSPKIPNTAFKQGFMIRIGYEKKEILNDIQHLISWYQRREVDRCENVQKWLDKKIK